MVADELGMERDTRNQMIVHSLRVALNGRRKTTLTKCERKKKKTERKKEIEQNPLFFDELGRAMESSRLCEQVRNLKIGFDLFESQNIRMTDDG